MKTQHVSPETRACQRLEKMIEAAKSGSLTSLTHEHRDQQPSVDYKNMPDHTVYAHI